MTNTKVAQVQGLRRSNAARPIPSKKVRREGSRSMSRRASVERSKRGE